MLVLGAIVVLAALGAFRVLRALRGHGQMFASVSKRKRRRSYPIHAYVGGNGSGKSAAAVWDTLPSLAAGRPVLSTVRLLDTDNPRLCEGCETCDGVEPDRHRQAHPLFIPFTSWKQLMEAKHCDVLMDEVTGVASSLSWQDTPAAVINKLVQLRRADVVVRWTSPAWSRSNKVIRECTQAVTHCKGMFPRPFDDGQDRQWVSKRMYRWATYDAFTFDEFTDGRRKNLDKVLQDLHWAPTSGVWDAYDTFEDVLTIGTVSEGGTCWSCGGSRRRPACSCPDKKTTRKGRVSGTDETQAA